MLFSTCSQFDPYCQLTNKNWLKIENNNDQIDYYQKIEIKVIVIKV